MSFSQLPAIKKTPFLVQLKQIFGPSYFVTALACSHIAVSVVVHGVNVPNGLKNRSVTPFDFMHLISNRYHHLQNYSIFIVKHSHCKLINSRPNQGQSLATGRCIRTIFFEIFKS